MLFSLHWLYHGYYVIHLVNKNTNSNDYKRNNFMTCKCINGFVMHSNCAGACSSGIVIYSGMSIYANKKTKRFLFSSKRKQAKKYIIFICRIPYKDRAFVIASEYSWHVLFSKNTNTYSAYSDLLAGCALCTYLSLSALFEINVTSCCPLQWNKKFNGIVRLDNSTMRADTHCFAAAVLC